MRQVDDFAIACELPEVAQQVINDIDAKMSIKIKELGQVTQYNGVDVLQTRDYIKIYNNTYTSKIINNHKWLQQDTKMGEFPVPMSTDPKYHTELEQATPLTPLEKEALETELGFSYR